MVSAAVTLRVLKRAGEGAVVELGEGTECDSHDVVSFG